MEIDNNSGEKEICLSQIGDLIFKPGGTLSGGSLTGAPTTKVSQHELDMHNQLELEAAAQRVVVAHQAPP